jgi:membrane protein implicated in regulation of membrane protease activity
VITVQMKRIEGRHSPLAYIQLALGALLAIEFVIPVMVLQAAAFRPGLPAGTIRTLDDLGWLLFVGAPSTAIVEAIVLGVAILQDRRREPVFPRWSGYLSIWCALLFAPGGIIVFFKHGPFGWNGLLTWWLGLTAFGIWLVAVTVLLLRAVRQQDREEREHGLDPGGTAPGLRLEQLSAEVASLRDELRRATAAG